MRIHLARKLFTLAAFLIVGVLAGPFGTYDALSAGERFVYWLLATVSVGAFMNLAFLTVLLSTRLQAYRRLLLMIAASAIAAIPSTGAVLLIERAFRPPVSAPDIYVELWATISVIGLVIGLFEYRRYLPPLSALDDQAGSVPGLRHADVAEVDAMAAGWRPMPASTQQMDTAPTPDEPAPVAASLSELPLFLRTLAPELGHELISLTTHDHYLEVVTRAGQGKILKRMADAVVELGTYPGMQIHRSHWVAFDAVERLERDGRKLQVMLSDGRSLPVSRPNAAPLAEAFNARNGA